MNTQILLLFSLLYKNMMLLSYGTWVFRSKYSEFLTTPQKNVVLFFFIKFIQLKYFLISLNAYGLMLWRIP